MAGTGATLFGATLAATGAWAAAGVLMMVAGISLQKSMRKAAVDAQADSSLQNSLLVESIAGAETLKAARAEGGAS